MSRPRFEQLEFPQFEKDVKHQIISYQDLTDAQKLKAHELKMVKIKDKEEERTFTTQMPKELTDLTAAMVAEILIMEIKK